ncbi:hypothetical protein BU24DRAFT_207474 [Aaosphaeria arxii CBS 175.79]|uniref:Uncharacterized protein n=1 Tax=Aaosphaeria arxii CBS 175.79 TaxID=1450172 RepID=A0A6A5XUQ4_9PLEO|nr:uncharacterized protein BU24DRAFT_207474 [Aaosphaeria arxii CBS 175.79]KAF2016656.1 hypothetical protein BU24DRAFT_207474 [Aaosphaeria arxii CBS 175.79]
MLHHHDSRPSATTCMHEIEDSQPTSPSNQPHHKTTIPNPIGHPDQITDQFLTNHDLETSKNRSFVVPLTTSKQQPKSHGTGKAVQHPNPPQPLQPTASPPSLPRLPPDSPGRSLARSPAFAFTLCNSNIRLSRIHPRI